MQKSVEDEHAAPAIVNAKVSEKRCRLSLVVDTSSGEQPTFALDDRITTELRSYMMMPRLKPTDDPLAYYTTHTHLPLLARCARMLLPCPATSVPSERVFSAAGQSYVGRPSLSAKNAEMLIVCKYAFKRGIRCDIRKNNGIVNDAVFNFDDSSDVE